MRSLRFLSRAALACALALSLAACDSNEDEGDGGGSAIGDPGTFSATLSGAVSESYEGEAESITFGGQFYVSMDDGSFSSPFGLTIYNETPEPPPVGSYTIAPSFGGGALTALLVVDLDGETTYVSTEETGTLVVEVSTAERFAATFSIDAALVENGEDRGAVSVSGAFNSVPE
jgi:hypothetical protein